MVYDVDDWTRPWCVYSTMSATTLSRLHGLGIYIDANGVLEVSPVTALNSGRRGLKSGEFLLAICLVKRIRSRNVLLRQVVPSRSPHSTIWCGT